MPYHVILPLFALALGAEALALLVSAAIPTLRRGLPYLWRMVLGSVTGFVLANLGSLLFGAVPCLIALALRIDKDSEAADVVAGFALLGLFIGPLIVSPLGFLGGAMLGLRRARARLVTLAPRSAAAHEAPARAA